MCKCEKALCTEQRQALISWLTQWGHKHKGLNLFLIGRRDQKHISFLGKQWGTQHTLNKYFDHSLRASLVTTPVLRCCYLLSIGILSFAKHVSISSLFADMFLFLLFPCTCTVGNLQNSTILLSIRPPILEVKLKKRIISRITTQRHLSPFRDFSRHVNLEVTIVLCCFEFRVRKRQLKFLHCHRCWQTLRCAAPAAVCGKQWQQHIQYLPKLI